MKYRLEELFELQLGKTPSRNNSQYWCNQDNKWIAISDLTQAGKYITDTKEFISDLAVSESGIRLIPANTVIMSFKLSIGKTAITSENMYSNEAIMAFCDKHVVDLLPEYIYYMFKYRKWDAETNNAVMGKTLNKATLSGIEVFVQSIDRQKEIVEVLNKVSDIIENRQNQLIYLDTLIKSRFVEFFGSIREERFETKTLSQIVVEDKNSIKRGPFGGSLKKDDFVTHGYLVYEQRHAIHNDFQYEKYYITKEKYEEMIGFKVVPEDLIVSCSGTLGRIAEVPKGAKEGIINQALLKVTLDQSIMINTFFVNQFRSDEIQELLFGFSRGSGIPNMPSMSEVKAVKFVCPPIELQKQFAAFVEQVDKLKVAVQKSLDETQLLMDSLMQQYFG